FSESAVPIIHARPQNSLRSFLRPDRRDPYRPLDDFAGPARADDERERQSVLGRRDAGIRGPFAGSGGAEPTGMNRTRTFRAPGRVNLIGEHTDYNLGFVLPIALDLATYIETSPAEDGRLRMYSEQHHEERSFAVQDIGRLTRQKHWSDYVIGVAQQLLAQGVSIQPLSLRIRSNVPEGSGLSSSAALEVSTAFALLQGRPFDKL